MTTLREFFSLPMTSGRRDRQIAVDELGRPVFETPTGDRYTMTEQPRQGTGEALAALAGAFREAPLQTTGNALASLAEGAWNGVEAPGNALRGLTQTYGDAADTALDWGVLGAAGTAPEGALRIFAGRSAQTADRGALEAAQRMASEGASRDDIWRNTGWFQGVDGQWRFEIDDSDIRLSSPDETNALADSMRGDARAIVSGIDERNAALREQPDLFPADLRRLHGDLRRQAQGLRREASSNFGPEWDHSAAGQRAVYAVAGGLSEAYPDAMRETIVRTQQWPAGHAGSYNGQRSQLELTTAARDERSTLLHELQHMLQNTEGFARGSNPEEGMRIARERVHSAAMAAYDQMQEMVRNAPEEMQEAFRQFELDPSAPFAREAFAAMGPQARRILQQWDGSDTLARSGANLTGENAMAFYRRSAGEVEARNVQARAGFTPEQRRAIPPWQTQDVPDTAQILRYGGNREPQMNALRAFLAEAGG